MGEACMGMKDYKGLLLLLFRTLSHGGGVYGDEGLQEIVVVIIQDTFAWGGVYGDEGLQVIVVVIIQDTLMGEACMGVKDYKGLLL
jgi:hypothetical protein